MASFSQKLVREVKRSPMKAAVLATLSLVAAYFWLPLLSSGSGSSGNVGGAPSPTVAASPLAPSAPSTAGLEAAPPTWQQVDAWMLASSAVFHAGDLAASRDPFVFSASAKIAADELASTAAKEAETKVDDEATPESLGMTLSSTFVGPKGTAALIGGQTYKIGDAVVASHEGLEGSFTLVEIHPRYVVLEGQGNHYELVMPREHLASQWIRKADSEAAEISEDELQELLESAQEE